MSTDSKRLLGGPSRLILAVLALAGVASFGVGLTQDAGRAWHALLVNNFYFFSIALMAAVFIAIHNLARAGWTVALRRIPEALTGYLPVGSALMIALLFGMAHIYHWAEPGAADHDAILQAKSAYLNVKAFSIRMILFLGLWFALIRTLVRYSVRQDSDSDPAWTERGVRLSAVFIIIFALTFTLASVDWIMSLDPHWYSTLFPWYVMSTSFVASLAMITLIAILMKARGSFPEFGDAHFHDLGKYVFAFSVFWGYLWFSQYLLIWYSNIPEETTYFRDRTEGWMSFFVLNPIVNLVFPFIIISAKSKRNVPLMICVCVVILLGHWLDVFLMVMPSFTPAGPQIGWIEIGVGLGVASLFILSVDRALASRALVPQGDPYLAESIAHHG